MTSVQHRYAASLSWTDPSGTDSYCTFCRDHEVRVAGKPEPIAMSAPVWSRGNPARHSPGELLLAAVVSGHMIRFLEVASEVGLVIVDYHDDAEGLVELGSRGDGKMGTVTLRPTISVRRGPHATEAAVRRLHERAASMSVIRASVAVDVFVEPGPLLVLDPVEAGV